MESLGRWSTTNISLKGVTQQVLIADKYVTDVSATKPLNIAVTLGTRQ
ncbi:MAG: hypothetical protein QXM52_06655 [Candidatus Bathyarchaeia archaeon]